MNKAVKYVAILFILAGIVCGGVAFLRYYNEKTSGDEYEMLREQVVKPEIPEEVPDASETEPVQPEVEAVECPIDFAALKAENPDIYAWIQIPGTKIDYPILCRQGDNTYYLDHSYTGKKKAEGAIFTEDLNSQDFTDPNTVIYGHNMKNGSMFRDLHKYSDKAFFEEYQDVIIYTPEQMLQYHIFAAYTYDDRHILKSFNFMNADFFSNYLQEILDKRKNMRDNIDNDVVLSEESRLITLSTCTGNSEKRYLVQAVLTESRPIKEEN